MTGADLIRRLRRFARREGLPFREDAKRGKGDHRTIYLGDRVTIVGDFRKELPKGTLHGICRQLAVDPREL